jgi:hypothetical protein
MTDEDPFANLALTNDQVRERLAIVPRKIAKRRRHFIRVPWVWAERLVEARLISTYRVALHVLYEDWRQKGGPVKLSNGGLAIWGVTRGQKWRALAELVHLGLITIERRPRRSPLITPIVPGTLFESRPWPKAPDLIQPNRHSRAPNRP